METTFSKTLYDHVYDVCMTTIQLAFSKDNKTQATLKEIDQYYLDNIVNDHFYIVVEDCLKRTRKLVYTTDISCVVKKTMYLSEVVCKSIYQAILDVYITLVKEFYKDKIEIPLKLTDKITECIDSKIKFIQKNPNVIATSVNKYAEFN